LVALATSRSVWFVPIGTEVIHGTLRTMFLASKVGDVRARQIGVFTGSLLTLGTACLFIRWIGAQTARVLAGIGVIWVILTVAFEVSFGRIVLGSSWTRIRADHVPRQGGLLPLGLAARANSPLIAARIRHALRPERTGSLEQAGERH